MIVRRMIVTALATSAIFAGAACDVGASKDKPAEAGQAAGESASPQSESRSGSTQVASLGSPEDASVSAADKAAVAAADTADIPTEEQREEAAEKSITADNASAELDKLEKEIAQ